MAAEGEWDGARSAPSWRLRADWIPAYAGMTVMGWVGLARERRGAGHLVMALARRVGSRLRGNDGHWEDPAQAEPRNGVSAPLTVIPA